MGSVDIVLPSRDSARIAKSELLTLQIYELFLKLASFLAKKKQPSFRVAVLKWSSIDKALLPALSGVVNHN
jgi:hypothetical protein